MKAIFGPFFRAIVSIVMGVLLISYDEQAIEGLTIVIGGLFFLSGVFSCLSYWLERKRAMKTVEGQYDADGNPVQAKLPFFPIVGVGSLILGAVMASMTKEFIVWVVYSLTAILVLGAINQLVSLGLARRYDRVPAFYWVLPIVTLLVAVYVLVNPIDAAALPVTIIGYCLVFYGVVECVNTIQVHRMRRAFEKAEEQRIAKTMAACDIEDAEVIEE